MYIKWYFKTTTFLLTLLTFFQNIDFRDRDHSRQCFIVKYFKALSGLLIQVWLYFSVWQNVWLHLEVVYLQLKIKVFNSHSISWQFYILSLKWKCVQHSFFLFFSLFVWGEFLINKNDMFFSHRTLNFIIQKPWPSCV